MHVNQKWGLLNFKAPKGQTIKKLSTSTKKIFAQGKIKWKKKFMRAN